MIEKVSKSTITDAFWKTFQDKNPQAPDEYYLLRFGGSNAALATELANLVVNGSKRATATLLRDFENGAEPVFPKPGQLWVLINGAGDPLSVVRTTQVDIVAFGDVDAAFAWDEGEGDRSLARWRDAHLQYFGSQAATQGFKFDEHSKVVLERFEVLWPNDSASKLGQVG
jgi:uncharacterized protein YhfF